MSIIIDGNSGISTAGGTPIVNTMANPTALGTVTSITSIGNVSVTGAGYGHAFADGSLQTTVGYTGFRNRVINGAMVIDQRNVGAAVTYTPTAKTYFVDRFSYRAPTIGSASVSLQQVNDAPYGLVNSLKVTVNTAGTPSSGNILGVTQEIEGYNMADFAWNTSSAKTVTLSFWVKSSITGSFGVALRNTSPAVGAGISYVSTYSITSSDTWEYKTITIPGYSGTDVTINTTNGTGIAVVWDMGSGSNLNTTPGVWIVGNKVNFAGCQQLITNVGATWQLTGVQLEVGPTATPFEFRPYGTELSLCQRYYFAYAPANTDFQEPVVRTGLTSGDFNVAVPVTMRTTPALVLGSSPYGRLVGYDTAFAVTTPSVTALSVGSLSSTSYIHMQYTSGSMTAAQSAASCSFDTLGAAAGIGLSAEL